MHFKSFVSLCLIGQVMAQATTDAPGSETDKLPPSPTGSICQPHGDHWHCQPSSTVAPVVSNTPPAASCSPHGDHWHCPSGVPKPTAPPAQTQTGAPPKETDGDHDHDHDHDEDHGHGDGKECTPHDDHWHCPSGVSAPTYPPTAATTKATSTKAPSNNTSTGTGAAGTSTVTAGASRANLFSGAASIAGVVLLVAAMA